MKLKTYNGAVYLQDKFLFRYRARTYSEIFRMSHIEMVRATEDGDAGCGRFWWFNS